MNIKSLNRISPPPMLARSQVTSHEEDVALPQDSFQKSERPSISLGAAVLAGISLLGLAACTPPPAPAGGQQTAVENTVERPAQTTDLAQEESKPTTELEIRLRELELREREVATRERQLELEQKRESNEARLRRAQERRDAYERGQRIGEGIEVVGEGLGDLINQILR